MAANKVAVASNKSTSQFRDPGRYAANAAFVAELAAPALDLLAAEAGESILDLGCGDGVLSEKIAATGCRLTGVDASAEQIAAARARGLDAHVMDGRALDYVSRFEGIFSNAALHWMRPPERVISGVFRALRPGGRFVGEMGGAGNVATIRTAIYQALEERAIIAAAIDPWYFPSAAEYRGLLEEAGFMVSEIALHPRPTRLPGAFSDWLDTFAEDFIKAVPKRERAAFKRQVELALTHKLRGPEGIWTADYVRLRFKALKPAAAGTARP